MNAIRPPAAGAADALREDDVVCLGAIPLKRHRPLDGAFGTQLLERFGAGAEEIAGWHRTHPNDVESVYNSYREAGAQALTTNTLTAVREPDTAEVIAAAVRLARRAAADLPIFVSLAPLPAPADVWQGAIEAAADAGAAAIQLETATDVRVLSAVVRILRRFTADQPIVALLVPDAPAVSAVPAAEAFERLRDAGATAVGTNCAPPDVVFPFIDRLAAAAPPHFPIIARPSAGTPVRSGESCTYPWAPSPWAERAARAAAVIPNLRIGGCCGAGPRHIAELTIRMRASEASSVGGNDIERAVFAE